MVGFIFKRSFFTNPCSGISGVSLSAISCNAYTSVSVFSVKSGCNYTDDGNCNTYSLTYSFPNYLSK